MTEVAESHVLIESQSGDSLLLWDTPGFGDSTRVLKRLQQGEKPVGWFLSHVWDRFADRPFWCSQQAMHNAREISDVVLYVVNAGEQPSSAGYIDAEMRILGWIGKPVILLLNQLGPPRNAAQSQADVAQWQAHIAQYTWVEMVLPFDAFARCWVQEGTLLVHVQRLLKAPAQQAFERLRESWRERNLAVFRESMQALADQLAAAATDTEPLEELDIQGKARAWLGAVATGAERSDAQLERAQAELAGRLDQRIRATTEKLVQLHGLSGRATDEVLKRMGSEFAIDRPADADKASVLGGLVSGALGGLAADLGAGGLTFRSRCADRRRVGGIRRAGPGQGLQPCPRSEHGNSSLVAGVSIRACRRRPDAIPCGCAFRTRPGRIRVRVGAGALAGGRSTGAGTPQVEPGCRVGRLAIGQGRAAVAAGLLPLLTASAQEVLIQLYPDVALFR